MKKIIALFVAAVMILSLTSCFGGGKKTFLGTWDIVKVVYDGTEYTPSELASMGDDSFSGIKLVIAEGGRAGLSQQGQWEELGWENTEEGLVIGDIPARFEEDYLIVEEDLNALYFIKTSDSQSYDGGEEDDGYDFGFGDDGASSDMSVYQMQTAVLDEFNSEIDGLYEEWNSLKADIVTYDDYVDNVSDVEAFYATLASETEGMAITAKEYAADMAYSILYSNTSIDSKYEEIDIIFDAIYSDALDLLDNRIEGGILDEMNEYFYYGIFENRLGTDEWYDLRDAESDMWDASFDAVSSAISIAEDDVYALYDDITDALIDENLDLAKSILDEYELHVYELVED